LTFFASKLEKQETEVDFYEIFKVFQVNFSIFHGILAKSLKNKPFFLKKTEPEVDFS
jgi:hypothetical protein